MDQTVAQWQREAEFRRKVLDVILYFASEEGTKPLPNGEAAFLLPMSYAIVEYMNGNTDTMPTGTSSYDWLWYKRLNEEIKRVLENNSKALTGELKKAICDLVLVEWKSDHGESWWESGMRWELQFRQRGIERTFCLTHPDVIRIQENIKSIAHDTVEHCKQIGLLMRKHILAQKETQ